MTTEKWQLYSQAGVDGPEYGIRIRPGYTVVGFRKEDALAIVTWQNAFIQPEGDIMEKAKALRNAALPRRTYSIPGQTGYGNPSLSKGWDFSAVDELVRVVVLELIAEVERLRSDWRQEHATAETWKEDFKKMQKRLTDSELLRQAQYIQIAAKDARIDLLDSDQKRYHAAWMAAEEDKEEQAARIKELEEANRNIDKRRDEMAAFIERLEAAFLDSLAARLYYEHYPGVSDAYSWHDYPEDACHCMPKEKFREKAHEALERIKEGGKDE